MAANSIDVYVCTWLNPSRH